MFKYLRKWFDSLFDKFSSLIFNIAPTLKGVLKINLLPEFIPNRREGGRGKQIDFRYSSSILEIKPKQFLLSLLILIMSACGPTTPVKDALPSDTGSADLTDTTVITDSIAWEIDQLLNDSDMKFASVSLLICLDSASNVLYSHNPDMSLVPASVTKLLTTAAGIEKAGGRSNRTLIQYTGSISEGHILKGNIFIKGGADPTLGKDNDHEYLNRFGNAVKKLGIDSVTGRVIADAGVFDDEMISPGWLVGEAMTYYAGVTPGLMVNENLFTLTFNLKKKGLIVATPDNMKPFVHGVKFHNLTKPFDGDEAECYFCGMPYSNIIEIRGFVPQNMGNIKMAGILPDPPLAAATELARWLKQNGVRINDTAMTLRNILIDNNFSLPDSLRDRRNIDSVASKGAGSLIGATNKYSNNLYAETTLKLIGLGYKGVASRQAGISGIYAYLSAKDIDCRGLYLFDGSGISRNNAMPARLLAELLSFIKNKSAYYGEYKSTLSEAGEDGTLCHLCKNTNAQKRIFAKSGSMTRVLNYAGYAETVDGHTLIFAVMTNNFSCTIPQMKDKLEKLMIKMVEWRPPLDVIREK